MKKRKTKTTQVEDSEKILEECIECGSPYPADMLINGLCQDCRELMEAEMDLEDEEMKWRLASCLQAEIPVGTTYKIIAS